MSGCKANKSGVWTAEEDKLLAEWQSHFGNKWAEVARQIPGKTGQQCAQRWRHRVNPDIRREKWGADEDEALAALVQKHGNSWAVIARSMPGRTDQQCMGRWKRHLDPSIRRESWTPQEDALLFQLAEEYENAWSAVSRGLAGRTPQQCRTRWHYISGNANAAEASRAAIQAMRDAQIAAETAKAGIKKRRGRPSKNALAAAAAGMLTVLAPLPKATVMYSHPIPDPSSSDAGYGNNAVVYNAQPSTIGVKRGASGRRPGRPSRKKVLALDEDYPQPTTVDQQTGTSRAWHSNEQYDTAAAAPAHHETNINNRGSIGGDEAMLLDGFWNAVTGGGGGGSAPAPSSGEAMETGTGTAVATGRRNRPTRARIPSRKRTSFSMSEEDDDSEEEEEDEGEDQGYAHADDDDEDFEVKGARYRQQEQQNQQQQQQKQQRQEMWRPQRHGNGTDPADAATTAAAAAANADVGAGVGTVPADESDFDGEDDSDNEEYRPHGAPAARRRSTHAVHADREDNNNKNSAVGNGGEATTTGQEEYVFGGGIRTHPVNQQHTASPRSSKQVHQQQEQRMAGLPTTTAATAAAPCANANATTTTTAPAADIHAQHQQQQQYFEEPALLLGSSRAERRVSLGEVPLSPAVFSPALTPPWSRRKRQNYARLAAFGPSVPTSATHHVAHTTGNEHGGQLQHGTPLTNRRQHHLHNFGTAAATLQPGAPLASPGILRLLHSPESFRQRRLSGGIGGGGGNGEDDGNHHHHHHLGGHDDDIGHRHHHGHHGNGDDDDFFPGVFPDSPALPQFAGLITPEWARAAAAASAAAEDAEVRRFSIASVARRLDVDSVAVAGATGAVGATQAAPLATTQSDSPPQAGSLSVSLSLSAGGIPPAAVAGATVPTTTTTRQGAAITPAGAANLVAGPGLLEHPFFSPVDAAGNHLVLTEPPPQTIAMAHTTTATGTAANPMSAPPPQVTYTPAGAMPSSVSHGRTFLAAALQRTVGSGLMPATGTFFPANTMAGGHMAGNGNLATPMAIEDLLLATPLGSVYMAQQQHGAGVPQVAMTATADGTVPLVEMETMAAAAVDGNAAAQAGVASLLPAGQYNRVVLTNTTLTARKDVNVMPVAMIPAAATTTAAPSAGGTLSSNDVRMKLQALLEQV